MKVLIIRKSHARRTTYVVNNIVSNGCQTFHISQLRDKCKIFEVSLIHQLIFWFMLTFKFLFAKEIAFKDMDWATRKTCIKSGAGLDFFVDEGDLYELIY